MVPLSLLAASVASAVAAKTRESSPSPMVSFITPEKFFA
jgi:hypothetical protein